MFCTAQQSKVMCLFCLSCFGSFFSFLLLFPPSFYLLLLYSIQFLSYSTVLVFNLISLWYKIILTYFSQHLTFSNLSSWADFLLSSAISISSSLLLLYCLLSLFILFTLLHQFHLLLSSDLHLKWKKKKHLFLIGIIHVYKYMRERARGNFKKSYTQDPSAEMTVTLLRSFREKNVMNHIHHNTLLLSPKSREHPGKPGKLR